MKVAVIGAGVIGVSTAYYLNENGHEVTIIERLPAAGLETSFANGGMLTPSLVAPWNSPGVLWQVLKYLGKQDTPLLFRANALPSIGSWGFKFLQYSNKKYFYNNIKKNARLANVTLGLLKDIMVKIPLSFDFKANGTLLLFRDKKAMQKAAALADYMSALSVPYMALNSQATVDKEPALASIAPKIVGSFFYPADASGDAQQFTENLSQYLKSQKVTFHYESQAKLIKRDKKVDILVNGEKLDVDYVVLAGGIFSEPLGRTLGLSLPMRPCKGYSITFNWNDSETAPHIPVLDYALHAVATPLGKRLRVAGTAEFAGFNKNLTASRIQNLGHILQQLYPVEFANTDPHAISCWTGLRPTCVDGVPIIGPTPFENLLLNTGHGHLGWTMCVGSGKILADYLSGVQSGIAIQDYALGRFNKK